MALPFFDKLVEFGYLPLEAGAALRLVKSMNLVDVGIRVTCI